MAKSLDSLALKHLERRAGPMRDQVANLAVRDGWIRYVRSVFGMTRRVLARLTGLSISSVQQAERHEAEGRITLGNLRRYAEAMECDLVYAFVPRAPVGEIADEQSERRAKARVPGDGTRARPTGDARACEPL